MSQMEPVLRVDSPAMVPTAHGKQGKSSLQGKFGKIQGKHRICMPSFQNL